MFRVYVFSWVFTQKARSIYGSGLLWVLESLVEPTALDAPAKFALGGFPNVMGNIWACKVIGPMVPKATGEDSTNGGAIFRGVVLPGAVKQSGFAFGFR